MPGPDWHSEEAAGFDEYYIARAGEVEARLGLFSPFTGWVCDLVLSGQRWRGVDLSASGALAKALDRVLVAQAEVKAAVEALNL